MRIITVIILNVFVVHELAANESGHLKDSKSRLVDKLVNRTFKVGPLQRADLDDAMLGKPGHVAMSQRVVPVPSPRVTRTVRPLHAPLHASSPLSLPWSGVASASSPYGTQGDKRSDTVIARASGVKSQQLQWPNAYRSLIKRGLKNIDGNEALEMVRKKKALLVDVRPQEDHEEESLILVPEGEELLKDSINVPLSIEVKGTDVRSALKTLVTSLQAVRSMEINPDFEAQALERIPKNKPIIVMCNRGGKLEMPKVGTERDIDREILATNRYTTSLKAAYGLYEAGFKNLYFIGEGFIPWQQTFIPKTKPPYWQAFFMR